MYPNVDVTNNSNGLYAARNQIPLLSRILMSAIFIWSGISKIMNFVDTQEYMSAYGMRFTSVLLIAVVRRRNIRWLVTIAGNQTQVWCDRFSFVFDSRYFYFPHRFLRPNPANHVYEKPSNVRRFANVNSAWRWHPRQYMRLKPSFQREKGLVRI